MTTRSATTTTPAVAPRRRGPLSRLPMATTEITNVLVTQGFSMGTDVSAMVKSITFNGEQFDFNVAPVDGTTGPQGPKGDAGTAGIGVNGRNGTNATTAVAAGVTGAKVKVGATKR